MIGSSPGIGITVAPVVAERAGSKALLTVLWKDHRVRGIARLSPSTAVSEATCDGDHRDSTCSAKMVPTGGQHGFASVTELPTTPVWVRVRITAVDGKTIVNDALQVTPQTTYPNGGNCPAGGAQVNLVIDTTGHTRQARN